MSPETILAASVFAVVSAITPGPNNAMLMASGVNFGFRRSLRHLMGVDLGFAFMVLCVGLGLHSVLDRYPEVYTVLRYVGGAYMVWIAWKLASARTAPAEEVIPTDTTGSAPAAKPMGFWAAAAFQWVNPQSLGHGRHLHDHLPRRRCRHPGSGPVGRLVPGSGHALLGVLGGLWPGHARPAAQPAAPANL